MQRRAWWLLRVPSDWPAAHQGRVDGLFRLTFRILKPERVLASLLSAHGCTVFPARRRQSSVIRPWCFAGSHMVRELTLPVSLCAFVHCQGEESTGPSHRTIEERERCQPQETSEPRHG
jgi:hypothetical protein